MATIALYAGKINNMPGLIKDVRKSVEKYNKELAGLYQKTLKVDVGVCDLGEVMDSLRASSQTQEQRIEILENFQENSEDFIQDTIRIDNNVADTVDQNKDDFYDKYDYLKPDCEKSGWEKFCDACKAVGEWCKEHWKLIVTVVLVIVAIAVIIVTWGAASGPILILAGAAKGLVMGALIGGVSGGIQSVRSGGSFLDGFENGAFTGALKGAVTGAFMGGLSFAGGLLGSSCTFAGTLAGRAFDTILPVVGKIASSISIGMGLFDTVAFAADIFAPGNAFTEFNHRLHSSAAYNAFQISVTTIAAFSGGYMKGAQNRSCFIAGTLVLTAAGLVAIENIKAGDKIIALDPDTGSTEEKTVLETYTRNVTELVHLFINGEEITTTHDHPFFVKGKGFVNAGRLLIRDTLFDNRKRQLAIGKISFESTGAPTTVYNFQVEDFHTYFVGRNCVLVHNAEYSEKLIPNKADGLRREETAQKQLKEKYPESEGYKIEAEKLLRDSSGKKVIDPETGTGRRIDFVVDKNGKIVDSIEVTSNTADKTAQIAKEMRIRENGGNYVRLSDKSIVEIPSDLVTRIFRLP